MQEDYFGKHIFASKLPSKQKSTALNPKPIPKENFETKKQPDYTGNFWSLPKSERLKPLLCNKCALEQA